MLEGKIKDACKRMMAKGWSIRPGIYIVQTSKQCCPLVALAMVEGTISEEEEWTNARNLSWALSISQDSVYLFLSGFDYDSKLTSPSEYQKAGRQIREWLKEAS